MARSKVPSVVPVLPLALPSVLLPGTTLKIPIVNRADIAAVLANIYSRATSPSLQAPLQVGCVPLNSALLSPDGKRLIEGKDKSGKPQKEIEVTEARKEDLFGYGCLAKVSGVQGQRESAMSLIVEGVSRFEVKRILRERPFFEAEIYTVDDEGMSTNRIPIHLTQGPE